METTVILGLSFNTRMLGLAIISGTHLIDYHIQLRKDAWTTDKMDRIVASLQPWCDRYSITNIALSIPYEKQISHQTKDLIESVKTHFTEKQIPLSCFTPKTVVSFYHNGKSKKKMMKTIVAEYLELSRYLQKEIDNKNKYYVKLFDAIAVAKIHQKQLQRIA